MASRNRARGLFGWPVQRWRSLTQGAFFLLFVCAPILDLFRLDLTTHHFVFLRMDWTLDLETLHQQHADPAALALRLLWRVFLPVLGGALLFIFIAYRWGRLYCGWLCPHFSIVETINQTLRRAIGRQSLWDAQPQDARNPDGSRTEADAIWWLGVVPLALCCAALWAIVLLSYLLPPAELYANLWHGTPTRNQTIFIGVATLAFFIEFMFARHLFCRYACAVGLFQSLAWMANPRGMVVGYARARGRDCASCFSACDQVCPMRLQPRSVKRMMFACVQCGQCIDACHQTQTGQPQGALLHWVHEARAESEAALTGSLAQRKERHRQQEHS